MPITC